MKSFLLFALVLISTHSYGQYTQIEKTTKTVVQQSSVYLNGGARASVGGKSRVVIPFDLPENTIEWYYSFSTSEGTSGTKNLNLAIQLSSFLVDQSGTTASFLNQVEIPSGSSSIDVYLLSSENRTAFVEKWDNNGGNFYYIEEGTRKNHKQATVKVNDVNSGRWYLGLKNPSSLDGVNIFIEITAITQTEVYVDEWTEENKVKFRSACLGTFNTSETGKSEVCDCLVNKITSTNLPSIWYKTSNTSKESIAESHMDVCYQETGNMALKNAETKFVKDQNYENAISNAQNHENSELYEKAISEYNAALKIYPDKDLPKERISILQKTILERDYKNAISSGERNIDLNFFETALENFEKALQLKPQEEYPKEKIKELKVEIEKQKIEQARINKCIDQINSVIKAANASATVGDYKEAQDKITKAIDSISADQNVREALSSSQLSEIYNTAFWWSALNNDIESANGFMKKAITYKSSDMILKLNLGLFHLISGKYDNALDAFNHYKSREKMPNGDKWIDAISEKLNTLESNGNHNPDIHRMRSELKIK